MFISSVCALTPTINYTPFLSILIFLIKLLSSILIHLGLSLYLLFFHFLSELFLLSLLFLYAFWMCTITTLIQLSLCYQQCSPKKLRYVLIFQASVLEVSQEWAAVASSAPLHPSLLCDFWPVALFLSNPQLCGFASELHKACYTNKKKKRPHYKMVLGNVVLQNKRSVNGHFFASKVHDCQRECIFYFTKGIS